MNIKEEVWLSQYRRLDRELSANTMSNPFFMFSLGCNTNFTDSRLKFKRTLCFLLKQAFLHDQLDIIDKLIAHLLKTNVDRIHDVLCSTCHAVEPTRLFLNLIIYSYERKGKVLELVRFLMNLQDLNTRNINF